MNIWLIRDLEPIHTDPGDRRLMRAGMLATALAARGHATTWFTSSFDHYQKRQRSEVDVTLQPSDGLTIEVFRGPGYRRNISLARIGHNRAFAGQWLRFAEASAIRPDVLVTDVPTTEAAEAVVNFGNANGIPTVLSIRDLWPDFFVDYLPALLRPLARPFLMPLDRQVRSATAGATNLIGISQGYLDWGLGKAGRSKRDLDRVFPLGYAARKRPDLEAVAAFRQRLGTGSRSIVSFVGSWGATYDLRAVLDVVKLLANRTDVAFVVAGDADSRPELRDAFKALPNVELVGWLSAEDIALLVSASAIGLLPYHADAPQGLPNKVFEYMAYGAYQLATLKGEVAGFYAETKAGQVVDAAKLAEAITTVLPVAGDAAARAERIDLFDRKYSADAVYGGMVDHIERIAALSKRPPDSGHRS